MGLLKRTGHSAPAPPYLGSGESPSLRALHQSLESLLISGGDARLDLSRSAGRNSYGCTPVARPDVIDFASSTASSISPSALVRANSVRFRLWTDIVVRGNGHAFDQAMERSRAELRRHLGLNDIEIVFSPSGTDAQLQTLFLVKAVLGEKLTTIIVGADQTGSGTAHTARGEHFSDCTACGVQVGKGTPVAGLAAGVRTVPIAFCDEEGRLRSGEAMDAEVRKAVALAVGKGEKVLLQIMDASKLGWGAPGKACVAAIAETWPNDVCIVVDACQMRLSRQRLQDYLSRGYLVLITGSKFFTGPAFSGALLVPPAMANAASALKAVPEGLRDYSSCFDWPLRWQSLRAGFAPVPNYGQWLRWEAALEEMDAYFEVPQPFRQALLNVFAHAVRHSIGGSRRLELLTEFRGERETDSEFGCQTIFSFLPQQGGTALSMAQCAKLYRAMGEDVSASLPPPATAKDRNIAARLCQIGQPVLLRHRAGAALRLSASARLVSRCWSRHAATAKAAFAPELADLALAIEKLDWLMDHPEAMENSLP